MATQDLASWVSTLRYSSIPPSVVQAAIRSFYNWLGCAIGGSNHETTKRALKSLTPFFGQPTATVIGHALVTDPSHAALLNGIASHVHDYDDTHLETIIHPTGPVASALLAYSEHLGAQNRNVSGQRFITALVAGIEVECKLGLAVFPNHYDLGWHITSTTGTLGAAAAVSNLLGLSSEQTIHALGIATTQPVGLRDHFGSDTKSFHVGRAAQNGILAAVLAHGGFTASENAVEAKRGWVKVLGAGSDSLAEQLSTLGKVWEVEKNSFKPFPCGIVVHPIIDACIQLHDQALKGCEAEIESVHLEVHPFVLELTGKKTPKDGLQAKFSVYHGAAIGLALGKATPSEYEDTVVLSKNIVAVRDRITAEIDKDIPADAAKVKVKLESGKTLEKHVEHAVGSLKVPMNDEQLKEKFIDQAGKAIGHQQATEVIEIAQTLAEVADVSIIAQATSKS